MTARLGHHRFLRTCGSFLGLIALRPRSVAPAIRRPRAIECTPAPGVHPPCDDDVKILDALSRPSTAYGRATASHTPPRCSRRSSPNRAPAFVQLVDAERSVHAELILRHLGTSGLVRIKLVLNVADDFSSTLSSVTMSAVPPNSSITSARWACRARKNASNFSSGIISGTLCQIAPDALDVGEAAHELSRSLICTSPIVSSR